MNFVVSGFLTVNLFQDFVENKKDFAEDVESVVKAEKNCQLLQGHDVSSVMASWRV